MRLCTFRSKAATIKPSKVLFLALEPWESFGYLWVGFRGIPARTDFELLRRQAKSGTLDPGLTGLGFRVQRFGVLLQHEAVGNFLHHEDGQPSTLSLKP